MSKNFFNLSKHKRKAQRSIVGLLFLILLSGCANQTPYSKLSSTGTDSLGESYDLTTDYVITQYSDLTNQHSSFYTIENANYFCIIDGGWADNASALRQLIVAHNNHVDAWIISHPHKDHAGAFNVIMNDPQGIIIEQIYDNGFDHNFIANAGEKYDDITVMEQYYTLTKDAPNVTHLNRHETITICGLTVDVINTYDDTTLANVGGEQDYQNNASLMLRITNQESSFLICSDIKYDLENYFANSVSDDEISCDYIQVGHHGNWSLSDDFYARTGASVFFIDAPAEMTASPDYPVSALKTRLIEKGITVFDFGTAPNRVILH